MTTLSREQLALSWKSWYTYEVERHGPRWLQWVWTTAFCFGIALCFTVLGFAINAMNNGSAWMRPSTWLPWYGRNLVVSLVIGYTIHLLFDLLIPLVGARRIRHFGHGQRTLFFTAIPIAGVMAGWPAGLWLVSHDSSRWLDRISLGYLVGMFLFALLISFIFFQVFNAKAMQAEAEKRAIEAQLRLLQAQMEPHFLFNTLAGVLTLIDAEPARARRLLESFTDYLRATLADLRTDHSTVARELELAQAYLQLMQLRMEDRLRFTIRADEAVHARADPAAAVAAAGRERDPARARAEGRRRLRRHRGPPGRRRHRARRARRRSGTRRPCAARARRQRRRAGQYAPTPARPARRGRVADDRSPATRHPGHAATAPEPAMTLALIADDEPPLARHLQHQLAALWPELEFTPIARNGVEAAEQIAALEPDLAFLDIQMPGLTGLEVAQGIEGATQVVFVTAYDEYAVQAFEQEALDYVLEAGQDRAPAADGRAPAARAGRTRRRRRATGRDPAAPAAGRCHGRPPALGARQQRRADAPDRCRRGAVLPRRRQVHLRADSHAPST